MVTEQNKMTAQQHNIQAAQAVARAVRSTLGPMGMDKMMVDDGGNVIITNDGATILRELDVEHPGAKTIIDIAETQESVCYDGTTSAVVLGGQLLANSEALMRRGLHPNIICRGYKEASRYAVSALKETVENMNDWEGADILTNVARTAMTGKSIEHDLDFAANLCVRAVTEVEGETERIRVVVQPGGTFEDSELVQGVILHKEFVLDTTPKTYIAAPVIMVNTGLQQEKTPENMSVVFNSAQEAASYQKQTTQEDMLHYAQYIVDALPSGGVLFVRDGVADNVCMFLAKHNIGVVRRIPESDMNALSRLFGATIYHQPEEEMVPSECTGIEEQNIAGLPYIVCTSDGGLSKTLLLRGATRQTVEEIERAFDDAIGVVSLVYNKDPVLPGGGASYMLVARELRNKAAQVGGREQMAVESFADAMEAIPATIAENAGHDPLDAVLALRTAHQEGWLSAGVDIDKGDAVDMVGAGVFEPPTVVVQAIHSATEVAVAVLRIDDVMTKRSVG